jgi:hypothetical protein
MCEFSKYSQDGKQLMCKLTMRPCIYRKYCKKVEGIIHTDNWDECYYRNNELKHKIPEGSNYIRFQKNGYLYVELDEDTVVKIKNTIGEQVENYVFLKKYRGEYRISLTPFPKRKSKNSNEDN